MATAIDLKHRIELIAKHPLFILLSADDRKDLASQMRQEDRNAGEIIVKEGEKVDSVYFIVSGEVEVRKHVEKSGKSIEMPLAILKSGDSVGLSEFGLYSTTGARTATVTTLTNTTLLTISLQKFDRFLQQPHLLYHQVIDATQRFHYLNFIKRCRPFLSLSIDELNALADKVSTMIVPAHGSIFQADTISEDCYCVEQGTVEIIPAGQKTGRPLLAVDMFGQAGLLNPSKKNYTARAVSQVFLTVVSREDFNEILHKKNPLWKKVQKYMDGNHFFTINPGLEFFPPDSDDEGIVKIKNAKNHSFCELSREGVSVWEWLKEGRNTHQILQKCDEVYPYIGKEELSGIFFEMMRAGII